MRWLLLAPFVGAVLAAGSTGMLFPTGEWYKSLRKPAWTPPNWLFPVAWTILYVMIATAGYRIAASDHPLVPGAVALWGWNMVLNTLWTPVMFGARRIGTALVVILLLFAELLLLLPHFFAIDAVAGWLMVPYALWVGYAVTLNAGIWWLNRR